jgi:DNA-binding GntR family transcriptional regulator
MCKVQTLESDCIGMNRQGSTHARRRTAKLTSRPVTRATLPDEVYRRIKDLILDGNLAPGELVTIQGLAEAFDVSAMPVREALTRLTAERALTVVAGRSVGIPNLDTHRLHDLTRVRLAIETTAARWAAEAITAEQVSQLEVLYKSMDIAIKKGDRRDFVRANHDFHFVVYRAANSLTMLGIIETLWLQVSPYFHLLQASDNYTTSNVQHRRILDALTSRDADGVAAALHGDISAASAILTKLLL